MTIWLVFVLMTAAAALVLLRPLARHYDVAKDASGEVAFYSTQLAEIDRDTATGLLPSSEAEAARTEAGRRFLRATSAQSEAGAVQESEAALRRRRAASALVISMVPLLTIAMYGALGSPHLPDRPFSQRVAQEPGQFSLEDALVRIETQLARQPDDGRGWEVLAPAYLRVQRYADAARAYGQAVRVLGETPRRLLDQAEALTLAQGGVISSDSRALFERAQVLQGQSETDPQAKAKLRYYLALGIEQDGDYVRAQSAYKALLAETPDDAPWRRMVEARLSRLAGEPAPPGGGSNAMPQVKP